MDGGHGLNHKPFPKRTGLRIVDCDVHVDDPPGALAPYCEMPWRKSLEIMGSKPGRRSTDIPGYSSSLRLEVPLPGGHSSRSVKNAAEMRAGLDMLGIDEAILLPDYLLRFATLVNIDYAVAVAAAYNRWLTAEWLHAGNGFYGALLACPQDPVASAKEILSYAGTPGMVSVFLPTAGVYPLWGHRKYEPILKAAEEVGFPVILHSVGLVSTAFPQNQDQFENNWGRHVIQHPFAMMANMTSMMHTGIPVRFPNLQIVFTEAGIAWVPLQMWRMDRAHAEYRRQVPFFDERPSEYMKRQMWFCTQPFEESDVAGDFAEIMRQFQGDNRTLYASDWPHHDFDHPEAILKLPMTDEQRRKVMGLNAVELFKLPALVPQAAAAG